MWRTQVSAMWRAPGEGQASGGVGMTTPGPIAVKAAQAAEMVGISPDTLKAAIRSGALPAKLNDRGHYFVLVADLTDWFKSWPDA